MSYGLQISASGAFGALYRQDVLSNNLANMDTVGFKPEIPTTRPRQAVTKEDNVGYLPSNKLLERLGAGVLLNPNGVDFGQGGIRATGRDLDIAVQGEGFLTVRDSASKDGDAVLLTRDGRLARNSSGQLVLATTGAPVLDAQKRPIEIAERGKVQIDGNGTIRQNGATVATLALVDVPERNRMERVGASCFRPTKDQAKQMRTTDGSILQAQVEDSRVDEVRALMAVSDASREVDANVALIQQHDRMMERAIQSLGRTA